MPKSTVTKKPAGKGPFNNKEQDTPIIVGGGNSTLICLPKGTPKYTGTPPDYVNDPGAYDFYRVPWDVLSVYVKDGTGGNNKHAPKDKLKHYTVFSKNP